MQKLREKWKNPDGMSNNPKRKRHKKDIHGWIVSDNFNGPSKQMKILSPWIESKTSSEPATKSIITPKFVLSSSLRQQSFLFEFYENFAKKSKLKTEFVRLYKRPFQIATVDNFLENKSMIKPLIKEIEMLHWTRKQMDLYEFYQTVDLANVGMPFLNEFYKFLKNEVRCYLEHVTGMKFQRVSASCSMYCFGDHLLTHDDLLSDRLIAFVFYMSPWKDKEKWTEGMGGALELFSIDNDGQPQFPIAKRIFPSNNQFLFFKVEKKSFHQVGEILTKEYPRLTINGWFHGFENNHDFDSDAIKVKKPNVPIFKTPNDVDIDLAQFIRKFYLKKTIKTSIQKAIEENSETSLGEYLKQDFFNSIHEELKNNTKFEWILKGPSNQQCYEILKHESVGKSSDTKKLIDMFSSNAMFKLLFEYTELDLYGSNSKRPKLSFEIQRWKGGYYTLLGDSNSYKNETLDLILYFGSTDNVGVISYLTPEDEDEDELSLENSSDNEDDSTLLTIYPQNNYLNIVYRSQGTTKFTKYVSKLTCMDTEFNYIVSYEFYRILSAISYIVVIFGFGIPMWWKTTEIHRASIPSSEIMALDETPISFAINVGVFIRDEKRQKLIVNDLNSLFKTNDVFSSKIHEISMDSILVDSIKTPVKLEKVVMQHYPVKPGDLLIVEWKHLQDEILVSSDRTIFISDKVAAEKIYQVICLWIVRDYKIRSILGQVKTFDGKQLRHNFPPPSPEYEVLVSLLNPRPDLQTLHWNVKKATESYLRPFLSEFNELSDFTLKSQRKYQLELKYGTKPITDESKFGRHFSMDQETLPQIITSIERKLGTDVANKPCIHLVVYVPPCIVAPVYIYKSGQRVANYSFDSFNSAKWGGIVIANPSDTVCTSSIDEEIKEIHLQSHEIMDFVLYQLRKIFELEVEVPLSGVAIEALGNVKPRVWEKDMYLRNGAIHLIASASSTLQSLVKLLDDIKNIVIGDHVGAEIEKSYDNILKAKVSLDQNDIKNSVRFAREAYIAAEKAFNDPSLLELLYFPEEQKYAIYIPLYLPIMIPVILSIFTVKKYFFPKSNQTTTTDTTVEDEAKEQISNKD